MLSGFATNRISYAHGQSMLLQLEQQLQLVCYSKTKSTDPGCGRDLNKILILHDERFGVRILMLLIEKLIIELILPSD